MGLSENDRIILKMLYEDARSSARQIAKKTGLSTQTVINRMEAMEKSGIILGYIPLVDKIKLGKRLFRLEIEIIPRADVNKELDIGKLAAMLSRYDILKAFEIKTGTHAFSVEIEVDDNMAAVGVVKQLLVDLQQYYGIKGYDSSEIMTRIWSKNLF